MIRQRDAYLPAYQYRRLQSVLDAAAKLIYRRRRFDHVTSLLRELHWLKSSERVAYKLAVVINTIGRPKCCRKRCEF